MRMMDVQIQMKCQRCGTHQYGAEGSRDRRLLATTAVLGMPKVRPIFLDHLSSAETPEPGTTANEHDELFDAISKQRQMLDF